MGSVKIILPFFPVGTMERVDREGEIATAVRFPNKRVDPHLALGPTPSEPRRPRSVNPRRVGRLVLAAPCTCPALLPPTIPPSLPPTFVPPLLCASSPLPSLPPLPSLLSHTHARTLLVVRAPSSSTSHPSIHRQTRSHTHKHAHTRARAHTHTADTGADLIVSTTMQGWTIGPGITPRQPFLRWACSEALREGSG